MKTIRYLDLGIQAMLIAAAIVLSIIAAFKNQLTAVILWIQFVLGVWQYLSSLICTLWRWSSREPRFLYLILATLYLAILPMLALKGPSFIALMIVVPWSLAVYYFVISLRLMKGAAITGKGFLPHLGF
jgi:hypothetical protein